MLVDDQTRAALVQRLDDVLGIDHTRTLMALLPQVAGADLATKADIDRAKHEFLSAMHREMVVQTRIYVAVTAVLISVNAGVVVGSVALMV